MPSYGDFPEIVREKEEEAERERATSRKRFVAFFMLCFAFYAARAHEDVCARLFVGNPSCDPVNVHCVLRGLIDVERTHFYLLMHLNYLCRFLNFV